MWTWINSHRIPIAIFSLTLAAVAIASVGFYFSLETDPPSVPKATVTASIQRDVQGATKAVVQERTTNDEAIKQAYEKAKADAMALSADAVIVELNLLLDELRGGEARP